MADPGFTDDQLKKLAGLLGAAEAIQRLTKVQIDNLHRLVDRLEADALAVRLASPTIPPAAITPDALFKQVEIGGNVITFDEPLSRDDMQAFVQQWIGMGGDVVPDEDDNLVASNQVDLHVEADQARRHDAVSGWKVEGR